MFYIYSRTALFYLITLLFIFKLSPPAFAETSVLDQQTYSILESQINTQQAYTGPVNLPKGTAPVYENDLAWGKPAFASTFYEDGFPAKAVDNSLNTAYRTASSTGTWFYVDLGSPQNFQSITTTLFIDADFGPQPHTYFIASNDLNTWYIIFDEKNDKNLTNRGVPRHIRLQEPIRARYVGLFAADWNGGWADLTLFSVLPPQFPTVPQAGTIIMISLGLLLLLSGAWTIQRKLF